MERLYPLDANKKVLLAASDSGLYSYTFHNERLLRPSLLCSNYERGLSGVLYNSALYYSYINKEQSLLLRCLGESALQFRLDSNDTVTYHPPKLVVFGGFLLLIYFEQTNDSFCLKLRIPFADVPQIPFPDTLPSSFSELPELCIQATKEYLYLFLSAGTSSFLFRYTTAFVPEVLCAEEALLSRFRIPWETEKAQLEERLMQTTQQSELRQTLLSEKENELHTLKVLLAEKNAEVSATQSRLKKSEDNLQSVRNQLAECENGRRETARTLAQTAGLLERAKAQYEELMQVAIQYKEEAAKWYGKFTDRH